MLSFNQVLMSLGNAAGSEQRVEERGVLIPSARQRMTPMASPRRNLPPRTPPGGSYSFQWRAAGRLAG